MQYILFRFSDHDNEGFQQLTVPSDIHIRYFKHCGLLCQDCTLNNEEKHTGAVFCHLALVLQQEAQRFQEIWLSISQENKDVESQ